LITWFANLAAGTPQLSPDELTQLDATKDC
jgi:hypothetical protein